MNPSSAVQQIASERRTLGRYELHGAIASGGMATVHLGRLRGQAGFSRIVAIKRLHPSFSETPMLVSTLLDEAQLCSRIQHPNVVSTLDMVVDEQELALILEYVHGETLARLLANGTPPDIDIISAVMVNTLHGLHAAHEAVGTNGEPLHIVHRDVSPQNIVVGVDGFARVLDFGVAKARGRLQTTREGQVKGKIAYMAPEQIRGGEVDCRTDLFAAGVVMWEAITGQRLFVGENEAQVLMRILEAPIDPPSRLRAVDPAVDAIVMRALSRRIEDRFPTARAFAQELEQRMPVARASSVGAWVRERASATLTKRAAMVAALERDEPAPTVEGEDDIPTRTDVGPIGQETQTEMTLAPSQAAPAPFSGSPISEAEQRKPRRRGVILVGLVAIAAGVGLLSLRTLDSEPDAAPVTSLGIASVDVEVVTIPAGATVWLDGTAYGETPTTVTVPESDTASLMRVEAEGFVPVSREIRLDKAQRLELNLKPIQSEAADLKKPSSSAPALHGTAPASIPTASPPAASPPAASPPEEPAESSPFYRFE